MDKDVRFQPDSRAAWRAWLAENHRDNSGVWLVTWKKRAAEPTVSYEEAVEEALCFGWVDGRLNPVDDDRSMVWYSPRRPRSTWARTNKERVERLTAAGLMTAAGFEAVELARANGSWDALTDIDALVMPDDLAAALAARPGARERFDASSASVRRMALAWVTQPRTAGTRAAHIEQVAAVAASGAPLSSLWQRPDRRAPSD